MIDLFAIPLLVAGATSPAPVKVDPKPAQRPCQLRDDPGAACVMPPFKWEIDIYRDGGRGWRQPPDPAIMRDVWLMRGEPIPASALPTGLAGGPEAKTVNARLRLGVDRGGRMTMCQPRPLDGEKPRKTDSTDPVLLKQACLVVADHAKFRHALGADGQPVARDVNVTVSFRWDRFEIPMAPAPPPPAGFVSATPDDWPPATLPYGRYAIVEPDWNTHLTDRKKLPKEAFTGLTLSILPDGRTADCVIKASSGDPRLDLASCNALLAGQHGSASRWKIERYPVKVRWRKAKANLELPRLGVAPDLLQTVTIPADFQKPPSQPQYRRVRVLLGIDAAGAITGCEISSTSMDDGWDAASCAAARRYAKVTPGRDVFGAPAAGGLNLMVDWDKRSILRDGY